MSTDKTEQKILEQIENLKDGLQNLEDIDPLYMGKDLEYLRHKVLFVHARLEISLDILISKGLISHISHKITDLENMLFNRKAQKILTELRFIKKIEIAKALKKIGNQLYTDLIKVNTIRNKLSHPVGYQEELNKLKDQEKYLEVMEILVSSMSKMNYLFAEIIKKRQTK